MSNKTLWNHTSILASSRWLWAYGSYLCQNNFILNQFCLVWNSTEGWASFSLCCATHLPERQPLLSDSFCYCFSGVFLGHLSLWLCLFSVRILSFPPLLLSVGLRTLWLQHSAQAQSQYHPQTREVQRLLINCFGANQVGRLSSPALHGTIVSRLGFLLIWRDTMTMATLIREDIELGLAWSFRGSVHYHHGGTWWHAGRRGAGEVAESSTSCKSNRKWFHSLGMAWAHMRPQSPPPQWHIHPTSSHLLQQDQIS